MAARDGDIGERIEALLTGLRSACGEPAAVTGELIVGLLVDYYGDGLTRIAEIVGEQNPELLHKMAADPLVESQLVLHGLHPLTLDERIEAALDHVRPYLGSHAGGVSYLGVDDEAVAHLRLSGSCVGCGSSTVTVKLTIEEAIRAAAPEVVSIEVEGQLEEAPKLLQIGVRAGAAPAPKSAEDVVWLHPSALDLPADGQLRGAQLDGRQVLMAKRGESYYAYADSCPSCASTLVTGTLDGDLLTCSSCQTIYDIRLAGRAVDGSQLHLDPLPLLDDVSGIRVALQPSAVG